MMDPVQRMYTRIEEFKRKYCGKIRGNYLMSGEQILSLRNSIYICDSIAKSFDYGFYMGIKYQQAQAKKKPLATDQSKQGENHINSQIIS